jgi:hypothetical protein
MYNNRLLPLIRHLLLELVAQKELESGTNSSAVNFYNYIPDNTTLQRAVKAFVVHTAFLSFLGGGQFLAS